jgi:hypothetical protein
MKIRIMLACAAVAAGLSTAARAAETWTGVISDSQCGAHHEEAAEGADKMSDRECTLACVHGGSKFVLVSAGQVLAIANQGFAGLADHAGRTVKLTGTLENGAIVVSSIHDDSYSGAEGIARRRAPVRGFSENPSAGQSFRSAAPGEISSERRAGASDDRMPTETMMAATSRMTAGSRAVAS